MYTDLHLHTIYSDGEYTPREVIELARKEQVTTMAITDHNNLKGSKEAILNNPYSNMKIIPGVELSAKSAPLINIHILGYNMDLYNKKLNDLTDAFEQDAKNQVKSILALLKSEYGIVFAENQIIKMFSEPGNIGRPEIAKLCVKAKFSKDVEDAFSNLLNPIKHKQAKKQVNPTEKQLIRCIVDAGGIACLAHPESLKMEINELRKYIKRLASYGLEGIEIYHSKNPQKLVYELEKIAKEYNLLVSAGSDYHGPIVSPDVRIRHGIKENLNIKHVTILDKIEGKLK